MQNLHNYALSFVGLPYRWGGSNALTGFDCSGLVQEILASVGLDPKGRDTAQSLFDHFVAEGRISQLSIGALVFYGKSPKEVTHVAWMIDSHRVIEAGSGTSSTTSLETAAQQGAVVRIRPYNHRSDVVGVLMPIYPDWVLQMELK